MIEKLGITPDWECDGAYLTARGFKVGEYIADVHPFGMPNRTYEQFANVRVIEAAPEMLEALIEVAERLEDEPGGWGYYNELMVSAIESATGLTWEQVKERIK